MLLTRDKSFYNQVLRLTGFIALQNVIVCLVGLADNVMIGAYSQDALSGVALANQIQFFLQMLAGGIGEGMAVIAAQYWGTRRLEPIRRVVAIALILAAGTALCFLLVARLWPEGLLGLLTSDAGAIREGASYLRVICYSYPIFAVGLIFVTAQRSVENVTVGMIASLCGLGLNIGLNWALIFGNLGFPALGARGAAIATLAARVLECGVIVCYTYRVDRKLALKWAELKRLDRGLLRDFRKYGTPVVLASGSWGVAMTVQTAILGHLGSSAIAANSIANSLFQVISVIAYGMASASGVVIGKAVGRGERERLME